MTCILICLVAILMPMTDGFSGQNAGQRPEKISLYLNWHHSTQFLGYYVAEAMGYYAGEGLEVAIVEVTESGRTDTVPHQILTDEDAFGIGSKYLIIMQGKGEPLVSIAMIYQFGPQALFARKDSGIETLSDVAGRSMVVKGEGWQALIEELLVTVGLTLEDIRMVPGGFDMTPFYEGKVEVWTGFIFTEVARARLKGLDLVTFPLYEYGITQLGNSIYTTRKKVQERPDLVAKFLRASLKGWVWAVENPRAAVDVYLKMFPDQARDREFHNVSFDASIPLIRPLGVRVGSIDCEKYVSRIGRRVDPEGEICSSEILESVWKGTQ